jgi:hypothetical protein
MHMNRSIGTTLDARRRMPGRQDRVVRGVREQNPLSSARIPARTPPAVAARALVLVHDLHLVLDRLEAAGIEALAFKGPVLDADLRGDPWGRDPDDLDFLVRRGDLGRALDVLGREGWTPGIEVHPLAWPLLVRFGCEVPLARPGRALVDLHWDLAPVYFAWRPDQEALRARARTVVVAGRPVPTFSRADGLLHLCAHGCLSDWTRAVWVEDVALALDDLGAADAALVLREARRTGALRMLAVGVALAERMKGAHGPAGLRSRDLDDPVAAPIADLYAAVLEGRAALPASATGRVALHLRSRERLLDRARHAAGLLHTPSRDEWREAPAPAPLRWTRRILHGIRGLAVPAACHPPAEAAP